MHVRLGNKNLHLFCYYKQHFVLLIDIATNRNIEILLYVAFKSARKYCLINVYFTNNIFLCKLIL